MLRTILITVLFIATLLVGAQVKADESRHAIGYIVSNDHRVYVLDLLNGVVIKKSKQLKGLGGISNIDFDPNYSRLYIASDRSINGGRYTPLAVVDMHNDFNIVQRFNITPWFNLQKDPQKLKPLVNSVFFVKVSPDGKRLYLGDSANPNKPITTVTDAFSGKTIDHIKTVIDFKGAFSPDGKTYAEIWPSGTVVRHGQSKFFNGGIAISRLSDGKLLNKQILKNNKGLIPPWGDPKSLFFYYRPDLGILTSYLADSGKVVSQINLASLTGLILRQHYPSKMPQSNLIALAMSDSSSNGYIVVLDVIKQREIQRIPVGTRPSNLIVSFNAYVK